MRFLVRLFAVIGLCVVLIIAGLVMLAVRAKNQRPQLPPALVLSFNFERPLPEIAPDTGLAALFTPHRGSLREVLTALNQASRDPRVKGLIARVGERSQGLGATQELREALARFRASGRFALVYADTFGEMGGGMSPYYLATSFDQIWLQPLGTVGVTGIAASQTFFRGALDNLGIEPQISKRADYKTGAEQLMEKQASPANQEMTKSLVDDLFEQMVGDIATARHLGPDGVRAAIDHAPLLDSEAIAAKLVDRLGYYDEAQKEALDRAHLSPTADPVDLLDYGQAVGSPAPAGATAVALVVGEGAITRANGNDPSPFGDEAGFTGKRIADAIDKAVAAPDVKAILFRVNSPGGSPVASETVRRAIDRAHEAGKPVVVSMGDVAGSGGYWVAMDADRIVAQPGTLTGSIGVYGGKVVLKGLADKVGVGISEYTRGANAGMSSVTRPFTESELARQDALLDDIYARFTLGVAGGRKLPVDKVRELAKGRVYTGRQARDLGLVDALGGYKETLAQVRELLKLPEDAPLNLEVFPRPKNKLEQVKDLLNGKVEADMRQDGIQAALAPYQPLLQLARPAVRALHPGDDMLMMQDLVVE